MLSDIQDVPRKAAAKYLVALVAYSRTKSCLHLDATTTNMRSAVSAPKPDFMRSGKSSATEARHSCHRLHSVGFDVGCFTTQAA